MKVLIYFDGLRLGDSMMFMPALKALRKKMLGEHITIVCGVCPAYEPLIQLVSDRIHAPITPYKTAPSIWSPNNINELYRDYYDLIIDTRFRIKTNLTLRLIPCKRFVSKTIIKFTQGTVTQPRVGELLLNIFSRAMNEQLEPIFDWSIDETTHTIATEHIMKALGRQVVVVAPGASTMARCVPIEKLVATANQTTKAYFIFLAGPLEKDLVEYIKGALTNGVILNNDDPFLTMALAEKASLTIANDSGGGHLLAATSALHISLFNRPDYNKWLPWSKVQHPLVAESLGLNHISEITPEFLNSYIEKLI